jgi:transposase
VRLIPPQYVKPYVKRGKNDRTDAAAICEAAGRPEMRFVPIKSLAQQADGLALKVRATLVAQRTQLVNALRGHAAEFGIVAAKGLSQVAPLLAAIAAEAAIPAEAQAMLALLGAEIAHLDARIAQLEVRIREMHRSNARSRLLATIPGIGPLIALTLASEVDPQAFRSGRHLAAWLGLTPREYSTGGKQRLGAISKAGNERLRALLVAGATAVIRHASRADSRLATPWLRALLSRKPRKLVAVALANKMARIAWAVMSRGEAYRHAPAGPALAA